jgi:hypothetical protein
VQVRAPLILVHVQVRSDARAEFAGTPES